MGNCCKSKEKINEQLKSDALSKISEFYLKMEYCITQFETDTCPICLHPLSISGEQNQK